MTASERFTERILKFVAREDYRPQKLHALARDMGISEDEYGDFHDNVKALMKTGRVVMGSSSALMLPQASGKIFGKYRHNPRGFGFVIPDAPQAHGDLFIPEGQNKGAMTGDAVCAQVLRRGQRGGRMLHEGRIVDIVARGHSRFVGELLTELGQWFVRPDGNTFHGPIFVADVGAKGAKAGDQVVVEISEYPRPGGDARGVILEVLGQRGDPGVALAGIIRQYGFPTTFPEDALEDARRAVAEYNPETVLAGREDLRGWTIITIDPDTARDFDDAISLRPLQRGEIELGVHIADVAHFVREGGPLDRTARERANSVYFPNHVIPMLPEVLSNGLCSLQEAQPRLTKSAFITYDLKGHVVGERFSNTVIQSAKRLTYRQATAMLEGQTGGYEARVVELLGAMDRLARVIRERRLRDGMLVLALPEVEVVLDAEGAVADVRPEDASFSHTIIEMFMVEANEAVGRLLFGLGVPHLRRIHPDPEPQAGEAVGRFLRALGMMAPKSWDRRTMQKILREAAEGPKAYAVNLAVLRSMEKAVYSPEIEGHFALASEHYVHFTSPIRRYPDLTVHRLFDASVRGELRPKKHRRKIAGERAIVEALGEHCSTTERRAEDAERELKLIYLLTLLQKRLGDRFDGIVTGVTNFGVFVQLPEYLVEGLIRFTELADDWWEVDAEAGCVIGERTGFSLRIGDTLGVVIARIDLAARRLDLGLAEPLVGGKRPAGAPPHQRQERPPGRAPRQDPSRGQRPHPGKKGRAGRGPAQPKKSGANPAQKKGPRRGRRR